VVAAREARPLAAPDPIESSRRILGQLVADDVLAQLARELGGLIGATGAWVSLVDPDQTWARGLHFALRGDEPQAVGTAERSALYALFRRAATSRTILRLACDPEHATVFRAFAQASGSELPGIVAVPVFRRGGRIGALVVLGAVETAGSDALLDALARCASTALDNAARFAVAKRDQERLFLFSEATDEAVWDWTVGADAVWWGGGIYKLLGGSASAGPGIAWKYDRMHPDDVAAVRATLDEALAAGVPAWKAEYRFQRGDGSWADVEDRAFFLRDEKGRAFRVVGALRDVTEARRAEVARQFLLDASTVLASELDPAVTLQRLVELAVPRVSDWCSIRLLQADGSVGPPIVGHRDPELLPLVREALAMWVPRPDETTGVAGVAKTGEPELVAWLEPSQFESLARSPEHLEGIRRIAPCSYVIVPLKARGRVLGVLSLTNTTSMRRFGEWDLGLARALADRAAVAIDNAALFGELGESRERLEVTLASIGDGVISTDVDGRVTFLNGAAQQLTGWSGEEAVGRPLAEVFATVGQGLDSMLVRRDGRRLAVSDSAAPIRGHDGERLGVVVVFRDVTDKRRLEDEIVRASKLESLGLLAGGIAHDFNNLLTAIVANVSIAERKLPDGHAALPRLAAASTASHRATELTRQLLTFAKGGAPVRASTELPHMLRDTCAFALQGSNCVAELRVAPDLRPVVADAGQIGQVLQNLVINAAQAMPLGGRIEVIAENAELPDGTPTPLPPGCYVRVIVQDEGPGIPAEILGNIFDPFFTTKSTGSGLGLATVHSIIRKHDGHVRVDSTPAGGARFVFYLPQAQTPPEPTARERTAMPPRGLRVLVMDDEAAILDLASAALGDLAAEVVLARDGNEAIAIFGAARAAGRGYDVVLLDLTVPGGLGGRETLEKLREIDPDVRAVVSSGYSNDPVLASPAEYGFQSVLRKPYEVGELSRALADAVRDA
jgi:PAS domain S-box-containing protein